MEEREISISPMFKWLTKRFDKKGKKVEKAEKAEKTKKVQKTKPKKVRKTKLLWGREFKAVKRGLDEEQVVDFVNNLITQHGAARDPLLETATKEAEAEAERIISQAKQEVQEIKLSAAKEAEAEAERIISQAKQEVQEIKLSAETAVEAKLATEQEAEAILSTLKRKTELIETEAKQRTLLYLLKAREEIEKQIREDYKKAYARLSSSLQDLMSEGQNIEVELKNKRTTLWESKTFELKEYEAALLSSSGAAAPLAETSAPREIEIEPDTVSEEKTEEPAQLQEEAPEEVVEQPVQLQEETPEEKTEEPAQPQEEAREEGVEQPAQLQEEALEEKTEEPTQEEIHSTRLEPADSQTLYTGEVELAIAIPVELKMISKLYNYLQTIPDIKILRTTGSWDRGTIITVVADKPIPLINIISEIPDMEVTPYLPQKDSLRKGAARRSLREAEEKGVKRIELTLKEAQST